MPYVLENLHDGERPSARAIGTAEEAPEGDVVVEEFPGGKVWDAASGRLREPTGAERLEEVKAAKVAEIHTAAMSELAPLFTEGRGEHELIFLLAAHVRRILGAQADPRLGTVEEVGKKALAKRDEVEAATTPEELEGISWT